MLTHLRRVLLATLAILMIVALGWWGLWTLAASRYRHVIDGWVEEGRANGYDITYQGERLFGFPRHLVLRFTNVYWKNTANILFHADDIDIAALPWRWRVFDAKFKNHVEIVAPIDNEGRALVLGGSDGRAHVVLDKEGYWKRSEISLTAAQFGKTPDYVATADKLEASAERPDIPPKDHTEAGLTLTGSARGVILPAETPTPFGLNMARLDADIRVMGAVPDFRSRQAVDAWNKDSGVVEFDNLHAEWGPLNVTAKGTIGFDDDLQPEGAFSATMPHADTVLKALMESGFIARRQEGMLDSALTLFAKPQSRFNISQAVELPVAVQLGGFFLGPVRIFMYPPIEWPEINAAHAPDAVPAPSTPAPAALTAPATP